jgi:transcriptional regulator with PAS, ATPase and Fis domain
MGTATLQRPQRLKLHEFHGMYTVAPEMRRCFEIIRRVAPSECTVLIVGESGSGKERVAEAIHAEGPRARAPFRAVNCAGLSPTLLESELFGHVRGAFTGAVRNKPGLFTAANHGTLFFDEVAEIPLEVQARLLRVLQEKTFRPVGATRAVSVDVRVISATNKLLTEEVALGRFREDLSYRIRVFPLLVPPLRERSGDVEALLWHFIDELNREPGRGRITGVSAAALAAIRRYPWPGNIRELRSVVEYAFVMADDGVLDVEHLHPDIPRGSGAASRSSARAMRNRGERERIEAALEQHHGKIGAAAKTLGMSRQTLWRKLYVHRIRST